MNLCQVCSNSGEMAANNRRMTYCPGCGTLFPAFVLEPFTRQQCRVCGMVNHLNPTPGVTVLVQSAERQILIGRRSASARYGNAWCLPGGYIEYEESFIKAAGREVHEETGLAVHINGIVNVVSNHLDDWHHTLVVVLLAEIVGGHLHPGDDLTELAWINAAQHLLVDYAFEADKRIIDCFFAGSIHLLPIDTRIDQGKLQRLP